MEVRELTHAVRAAEWQERIHACRSSGLSVTCWCAENQISPKTYYRWERICLAEAAERLGYTNGNNGKLIKVNPSELPNRDVSSDTLPAAATAELVIHCGQVSMEVNSVMPVTRIAELVSALNQHV